MPRFLAPIFCIAAGETCTTRMLQAWRLKSAFRRKLDIARPIVEGGFGPLAPANDTRVKGSFGSTSQLESDRIWRDVADIGHGKSRLACPF